MPVPSALVAAIVNSVIDAVGDMSSTPQQEATYALSRSFPAQTKKGELLPPVQHELKIDGEKLLAAPGLQIRNQQNLIVLPGTLQEAVPVRYQLDPMGNVWRIWILSAAEQSAP